MPIPFDPNRADKPTLYIQDDNHLTLCSVDGDTGEILDIDADRKDEIIKIMAKALAEQGWLLRDMDDKLLASAFGPHPGKTMQ